MSSRKVANTDPVRTPGKLCALAQGLRFIMNGAIVPACSVVSRDVLPYAIMVGNPARVVRSRFPEAVVAELLRVRWWDWDADRIFRNLDKIVGADIEALQKCR